MNQDLLDWLLLLGRWLHITTAVTWIGTSIFFMWMDRSFEPNPESKRAGHQGELWMVHGGGFYHVEKLQMAAQKVPERLHWFKWESYWTWMSGFFLVALIFYTGNGTMLLDSSVARISYLDGVLISLFSIFGSWFFYDFLWESKTVRADPRVGHALTIAWVAAMAYALCHLLSGRAAYLHVGAMLGTWMTANVFLRIIPRQVKMVEAAARGESVDPEWAKNAKNRSTHNTYLTLPVIFIMLSNHFPNTYGHDWNWLILLCITLAGAMFREYFVVRISEPHRSRSFAAGGAILMLLVMISTRSSSEDFNQVDLGAHSHSTTSHVVSSGEASQSETNVEPESSSVVEDISNGAAAENGDSAPEVLGQESAPSIAAAGLVANPALITGIVRFEGKVPQNKLLTLPLACSRQFKGPTYSNEVMVADGKVQNVLVRVVAGHEKLPVGPVPASAVEVDQRACIYLPRVVAVRAMQEVIFINSDPIFHNVKAITRENTTFNLAMPLEGQRLSRRFHRPEIFLETKCSVHPWMGAYIAVMEHPFFSVTNRNGRFEIPKLPAGKYTLEFWHEIFGTQRREVEIGSSQIPPLEIVYRSQSQ